MTKVQTGNKMTKARLKKLLAEVKQVVNVPTEEEHYALLYIEQWADHDIDEIINGISDGAHMDNIETTDLGDGLLLQKTKEQEFIDVDQDQVKRALMALMTKEDDTLGMLYTKWTEFNKEYFLGALPHPLITIGKMNNRTLGTYTISGDSMGIKNHIMFNRNFIALNTEERILETLRHEMIHQWQDEVLYQGVDAKKPSIVPINVLTEEGEIVVEAIEQKKRPKDWHNKDFKDYAKIVGIPADGDNCTGNKSKMPEPESYNRKFICGCVASNGYRMTVWSTRQVNATCRVCGKDYIEVPKGGRVIVVEQSHVEIPGEDAIEIMYKDKYNEFKRFKTKELKEVFLEDTLDVIKAHTEGVYQKNHNMYKKGFTHWVAFTLDLATVGAPSKEKKAPPKVKAGEPTPAVIPVEPLLPVVEVPKKPTPKKPKAVKTPKKPAKPKAEPVVDTPVLKVVEPPAPVEVEAPKKESSERSYKNAEDLLEVYRELGSIKGVAVYFGTVPGTIVYQAKKLGIDFKKGVVDNGAK